MTTPKNPGDALADMPPSDYHERDIWRWYIRHYDTIKSALTPKPSGGDAFLNATTEEALQIIEYFIDNLKERGIELSYGVLRSAIKQIRVNNEASLTPSPDYVMVPREPTREMIKSAWTAQYLNIGADMAMAENLAEIRVNDTKQKSQDQLAYEAMIAPYVNGEKK